MNSPPDQVLQNGKADLHIHSNYSDGSLCPEEIFQYAESANLKALSITDHDTVAGVDNALKQSELFGIEFIPGLEISARYGRNELHILGYFIDHKNKDLLSYLSFFQEERKKRAVKIVHLLNDMGLVITINEVEEKAYPAAIGRPHIADVMVDRGIVSTYQEAFDKYLGDRCPCYVQKYKIYPTDAVKLINQAGGVSFIAHPGLDIDRDDINTLIKMGIEGFEAVHPRHSVSQIDYYRSVIRENGLLECGGSDCHGNRKSGPRIGEFCVSYDLIVRMKKRLRIDA
jgi:predicted metal-dependent phosphoesterase TrpH